MRDGEVEVMERRYLRLSKDVLHGHIGDADGMLVTNLFECL